MFALQAVFAQSYEAPPPWDWGTLFWHVVQVLIYVVVGLAVFAATYLIIDKATPFSFHKVLIEDKNTAAAIMLGAVVLGIAWILAAAIRG
jgi:putative membrane protein